MDPARWARIQEIFTAAVDLSPGDRASLVDRACAGDADLSDEVRALLEQHDADPDFLETPIIDTELLGGQGGPIPEDRFIGQYRLVRPLGRGGMGEVFLAVQEGDGFRRTVALKVIRPGLDTTEVLDRFRLERRILATLEHPNIARLLDGGATTDGRPYFAMEYVEGEPIDTYADRRHLSIPARLELFGTICDAVQHAHQNLVVHRDIKPGNILVTDAGEPKLLDFGIGKVLAADESFGPSIETRTALRILTPEYAAPEQVLGEAVSTATDVHALGVLLYELLTGHRPFDIGRGSPLEIERAICTTDPVQPSTVVNRTASRTAADGSVETVTPVAVSAHRATDPQRLRRHLAGDLDNIVMVALRKEPGRRYASAAALGEDVRRHLAGLPVSARPDTIRYRSAKFVRRNAGAVVAAAAIVLALVASTVVTLVQSRRVAQERDVAVEERAKAIEVRSFLLEMFGGVGEETAADSLTARQLLDLQAARIDDAYADRPALRAEMMHVLAEGYERLALFAIADTLARSALELRRDEYGPRHPDVASSLGQVGWLQHQLGNLREAVPFLEESIEIRRGLGESQRLELSRSLNDLGIVLDNLGERDRAETLLEEALDIRTSMNGPLHRSVGVTANNLASVRYRKGNLEEAIRYQRQSVDALRASVGPDHQRSVVAQQNLAMYMVQQGDLDGAEELLRDLVDRQTRLQGPDHPVTALVMMSLGDVLADLGRIEEAEPLLRQALAIREDRLGPDHVDVGRSYNALALFFNRTGRHEEAIRAFERVLAINTATLGEGHLSLGVTHADLAGTLAAVGRADDAERHYRTTLAIWQDIPAEHPQLINMRIRFARFLVRRDRAAEALPILEAALDGAATGGRVVAANDARVFLFQAHTALGDSASAAIQLRHLRAARDSAQLADPQLLWLQRTEGDTVAAGPGADEPIRGGPDPDQGSLDPDRRME